MEEKVHNIIDSSLTSFDNLTVPAHTHNGADAPRINPNDFLPYAPWFTNPTATQNALVNGTWRMYNFYDGSFTAPSVYDYGFQLYWNNQWNKLDLADFYVSAQGQNSTQTINNGATATILFDSFVTQQPATYYTPATGIWSMPENSYYLVDATVTFAAGGVNTGTFTLKINDGTLTKSITFQASANKQTLHATVIMPGTTLTSPHVSVTNNSGAARTTTGAIDECVLSIKQLK